RSTTEYPSNGCSEQRKGPADRSTGPSFFQRRSGLAAVAHEPQKEQEQVDEVEVELEGAEDGALRRNFARSDREIDAFDDLSVVSRQAREHEDADRAHNQIERGARVAGEQGDTHVDEQGNEDADQ